MHLIIPFQTKHSSPGRAQLSAQNSVDLWEQNMHEITAGLHSMYYSTHSIFNTTVWISPWSYFHIQLQSEHSDLLNISYDLPKVDLGGLFQSDLNNKKQFCNAAAV